MISLKELDGRIQRIDWKLYALSAALSVLAAWLAWNGQFAAAAYVFSSAAGYAAQAKWDKQAGKNFIPRRDPNRQNGGPYPTQNTGTKSAGAPEVGPDPTRSPDA